MVTYWLINITGVIRLIKQTFSIHVTTPGCFFIKYYIQIYEIRGVAWDFQGVRTGRKVRLLKALQTRGIWAHVPQFPKCNFLRSCVFHRTFPANKHKGKCSSWLFINAYGKKMVKQWRHKGGYNQRARCLHFRFLLQTCKDTNIMRNVY